ncbi:MAG TPA: DNA-processing protein DprA [Acidimicrobiales bacterium]|nr:DNA-processing protein DprA [Acidimicrobiales bacterium]
MSIAASGRVNDHERGCAVALCELPMMGPGRLRALLGRWSPSAAWRAVLADRAGDDPRVAAACGTDLALVRARWARAAGRADPSASLAQARNRGIVVHLLGETGYPSEIADDVDAPVVCFIVGDEAQLAASARVAIIGTRSATAAGLQIARQLGADLAAAGVAVVSGLARGIDGAAHAGTLTVDSGVPIGVVGSGLDVPYPRANASLWAAVAKAGVLVSEAPPGAPPSAWRFPARNRIIAALADVVVVVESRASGGSMLTVKEAIARGRQVMAVPGSVASPASDGTNQLIYEGCCPVRDALDVLVALGLSTATRDRGAARRRPRPAGDDARVLDLFAGGDPLDIETVARLAGLSLSDTALTLDRLASNGHIDRNGAWWQAR